MQQFNEGLLYAGMGILVVFTVLIILMVVIMLMKIFAKDETEVKTAAPAPATAPAAAQAPAIDTNETIAVISAAVAAMSGDDPNKRLRVKSIKDQSGNVLWSTKK